MVLVDGGMAYPLCSTHIQPEHLGIWGIDHNYEAARREVVVEVEVLDLHQPPAPHVCAPEEGPSGMVYQINNYLSKPGPGNGETCPICCSTMEGDETCMMLLCMHSYHRECLMNLLKFNTRDGRSIVLVCPICNLSMDGLEKTTNDMNIDKTTPDFGRNRFAFMVSHIDDAARDMADNVNAHKDQMCTVLTELILVVRKKNAKKAQVLKLMKRNMVPPPLPWKSFTAGDSLSGPVVETSV